jgi:peptidoglycan/xylan/chitin deacetylase (PgdA/CDA1 family)
VRLPHERFDYSAIVDRPRWTLPGRARVAVWTIVNVEEWDFEKPMARQYLTAPQGVGTVPDVPNWAWHDYGMRVGFWRLFDALTTRKIRATTAINASVCRSYEPVARAMLDAGWEFMGHGVKQGALHLLPDQRAAIRESIQLVREFSGKAPKGWLGPGLTETWETLDLLAEEGIEYVSDWVNDDQPYEIRTTAGPLVSVPYTLELNDIAVMVLQHHESGAWVQRCRDQFDRLYAEGVRQPRVMAIAVHPYIHGVPHRIKYFEAVYDYIRRHKGVWLTTGEEIYQWYRTGPTTPPSARRRR